MKVLMLNYEYPPIGGGTGNACKHVLEEMKDREELEVDLVTSSPGEYREEDPGENIRIYRLDVDKDRRHEWKNRELLRYSWKGVRKARELDKTREYDVIHAWSGIPCGVMARFLDKPFIIGLRGSDVPGYNPDLGLQYMVLKPLIRNTWRNAEEVIPNSRGLRDLAQETLDVDMPVIPNGVDTEKFRPPETRGESEKLQVLTVARLTERKRVQDAIKAVNKTEDTELEIIGEGEKEEELRELVRETGVEEKVNFRGYIPHKDLPEHYRNADVFVLPSLNEGMSNTVLEAISSGLPLIVTDVGGTDELLDGNGQVVPKKDPEAIADELEKYRGNRELLEKHCRRSRKIAEGKSWEKVAESYIEKYREIRESQE
ncbi:MAG: glycosyltransferase family 4 protein [Candidatus Nanosalina sp.]